MNYETLQKHIESLKDKHAVVGLSNDEKSAIKRAVFEYDTKTTVPQVSSYFSFSWFIRATAMTVGIIVLIVAPLSFVAEASLPGDVLYSVKTNVNEEVLGVFVSKEYKDVYLQSLLEKRNKELEALLLDEEIIDEHTMEVFTEALEENVTKTLAAKKLTKKNRATLLADHHAITESLNTSSKLLALLEEKMQGRQIASISNNENVDGNDEVVLMEAGQQGSVSGDVVAAGMYVEEETDEISAATASSTPTMTEEATLDTQDFTTEGGGAKVATTTKDVPEKMNRIQEDIAWLKKLVESESRNFEDIPVAEEVIEALDAVGL